MAAPVAPRHDREHLAGMGERATHDSFIKEYLCELSASLMSDSAAGGYHGRIRQRIEQVLTNHEEFSAGRSALDAAMYFETFAACEVLVTVARCSSAAGVGPWDGS